MKPTGFAALLRDLRRKADLSQAELAEQAGLDRSHISHFEGGRRRPSYPILVRLAKALGGGLELFSSKS